MKSHTFLAWVAVIVSVSAAAYVTFYFSTAEAVYSRAVGTMSVTKFVPNEGAGTEYVTLAFSGILGRDSIANLSGWTLTNGEDFSFDLSSVELTSDASVKICEEGALDTNCAYHWSGTNVFSDEGGSLQVVARDGTPVVYIHYDGVAVGATLSGTGNYLDDVYTTGDKVTICEMQQSGTLKERSVNVNRLTHDVEAAVAAGEDIVPPFVFELKKSLQYHPGINWPAGAAILERGCQ